MDWLGSLGEVWKSIPPRLRAVAISLFTLYFVSKIVVYYLVKLPIKYFFSERGYMINTIHRFSLNEVTHTRVLKNGSTLVLQIDCIRLRFNIIRGIAQVIKDWNPYTTKLDTSTPQSESTPFKTEHSSKDYPNAKQDESLGNVNRLVELNIVKPKIMIFYKKDVGAQGTTLPGFVNFISMSDSLLLELSSCITAISYPEVPKTQTQSQSKENDHKDKGPNHSDSLKEEIKKLEKQAKKVVKKLSNALSLVANIGSVFFPHFGVQIEELELILSKSQQSYEAGHSITLQFTQIKAESESVGKSGGVFWFYELVKYIIKFFRVKISKILKKSPENITSETNGETTPRSGNVGSSFSHTDTPRLNSVDPHWHRLFSLDTEPEGGRQASISIPQGNQQSNDIYYTYKIKFTLQPVKLCYTTETTQVDQPYTEETRAFNVMSGFGLLRRTKTKQNHPSTKVGIEIATGSYFDLDLSSNIWGTPNHAKASVFVNSTSSNSHHIYMILSEIKQIIADSNSINNAANELDMYLAQIKKKLFESPLPTFPGASPDISIYNESTSERSPSTLESQFDAVLNDLHHQLHTGNSKQLVLYYAGYLLKQFSIKSLSMELAFKELVFDFVSESSSSKISNSKHIHVVQKDIIFSCVYNLKSNKEIHIPSSEEPDQIGLSQPEKTSLPTSHNLDTLTPLQHVNDDINQFPGTSANLDTLAEPEPNPTSNLSANRSVPNRSSLDQEHHTPDYFVLFPEFPTRKFFLDACVTVCLELGSLRARLTNSQEPSNHLGNLEEFDDDTRIYIEGAKVSMVLPIKFYTVHELRFASYTQTIISINNPTALLDSEFFISFLQAVQSIKEIKALRSSKFLNISSNIQANAYYSRILDTIVNGELGQASISTNYLAEKSVEKAKKFADSSMWVRIVVQKAALHFKIQNVKIGFVPQALLSKSNTDLGEESLIYLRNESVEINVERTFPPSEASYKDIATTRAHFEVDFTVLPFTISYLETRGTVGSFFNNACDIQGTDIFNLARSTLSGQVDLLLGWPSEFLSKNSPYFNSNMFLNIGDIKSALVGKAFTDTGRWLPLWVWTKKIISNLQPSNNQSTINLSNFIHSQQKADPIDTSAATDQKSPAITFNDIKPTMSYNHKFTMALTSLSILLAAFDGKFDTENLIAHGFVIKLDNLMARMDFKKTRCMQRLSSNTDIKNFAVFTTDLVPINNPEPKASLLPPEEMFSDPEWKPSNFDKFVELSNISVVTSSAKAKSDKNSLASVKSRIKLLDVGVSVASSYRVFLVLHQIGIISALSSGGIIIDKAAEQKPDSSLPEYSTIFSLDLDILNANLNFIIPRIDVHKGDSKAIYEESPLKKNIVLKSKISNVKINLDSKKSPIGGSLELRCAIPTFKAMGFNEVSEPLFIFSNTTIIFNSIKADSRDKPASKRVQFIFDEGCFNIPNNFVMSHFIDGIVLLIKAHKIISKKTKADKMATIRMSNGEIGSISNFTSPGTSMDRILKKLVSIAKIDIPDLRGDLLKTNKYIKQLTSPDDIPPIYIHGKVFALVIQDDPFETALSRIYQVGKKEQIARLARLEAFEKKAPKLVNSAAKSSLNRKTGQKSFERLPKQKAIFKKSKTSDSIPDRLNARVGSIYGQGKATLSNENGLKPVTQLFNASEGTQQTSPKSEPKLKISRTDYSANNDAHSLGSSSLNHGKSNILNQRLHKTGTGSTKVSAVNDSSSPNSKPPPSTVASISSTKSNLSGTEASSLVDEARQKLYEFESSNWITTIRKSMLNHPDQDPEDHSEQPIYLDPQAVTAGEYVKRLSSSSGIDPLLKSFKIQQEDSSSEDNSLSPGSEPGKKINLGKYRSGIEKPRRLVHSASSGDVPCSSAGKKPASRSSNRLRNISKQETCSSSQDKPRKRCIPTYNNADSDWKFPTVPLFCLSFEPVRVKIETPYELMSFDDIVRYMREIDPSVPENQEWSTLAPLKIKLKAGELRAQMRDLPVPLVYFPDPFRSKDPADIADRHKKRLDEFRGGVIIEGGFIISEQRANDEAVRFCSIPMSLVEVKNIGKNINLMIDTGQYEEDSKSFVMRLPLLKTLTFPRIHTNFSVIIFNSATLEAKKAIDYFRKGELQRVEELGISQDEFRRILSLGRLPTPSPIICWAQRIQPTLTEVSQRFESITSSSAEPSPPMAWWNKLRARLRLRCRFACSDVSLKDLANVNGLNAASNTNINSMLSSFQTSEFLFYSPSGRDPYDFNLKKAGYLFSFRGGVRFTIGEEDEYDTGLHESFKKEHLINIGNAFGDKPVNAPALSEILRIRCMEFSCWVPNIDPEKVNAYNLMTSGANMIRDNVLDNNGNIYSLDLPFLRLFYVLKLVSKFPMLKLGSVSNIKKEPFIKSLADLSNGVRLSLGFGYSIASSSSSSNPGLSPGNIGFQSNPDHRSTNERKEVTTWDVQPHAPENVPLELLENYDTYKDFRSYGTHFGISILCPYEKSDDKREAPECGVANENIKVGGIGSSSYSYLSSDISNNSDNAKTSSRKSQTLLKAKPPIIRISSETESSDNIEIQIDPSSSSDSDFDSDSDPVSGSVSDSDSVSDYAPGFSNSVYRSNIKSKPSSNTGTSSGHSFSHTSRTNGLDFQSPNSQSDNSIFNSNNRNISSVSLDSNASFVTRLDTLYSDIFSGQKKLSIFHAISPLHNVDYNNDIVACDSFIAAVPTTHINQSMVSNEAADYDSSNKCKVNLSATTNSMFMDYIGTFASRLMLPIKKGKLYPETEKKDIKFGRSLLSLRLGVCLADMQISHSLQLSEIKELESQELADYFDFGKSDNSINGIIDRFTSMQKNLSSKVNCVDDVSKSAGIDSIAPAKTEGSIFQLKGQSKLLEANLLMVQKHDRMVIEPEIEPEPSSPAPELFPADSDDISLNEEMSILSVAKKKEMSLRWTVQEMDAELDDFDVRVIKMKFILPLFLKIVPGKMNQLAQAKKIMNYRGLSILMDSFKFLEEVPEKLKWLDFDSIFDLGSFGLSTATFSDIDVMTLLWAPRLIYFTQSTENFEADNSTEGSSDSGSESVYSRAEGQPALGSDFESSSGQYSNKNIDSNSFNSSSGYSRNKVAKPLKASFNTRRANRRGVGQATSSKSENEFDMLSGNDTLKHKRSVSGIGDSNNSVAERNLNPKSHRYSFISKTKHRLSKAHHSTKAAGIIDYRKVLRDSRLAMSMLLARRKERLGYVIELKRRRYLERLNDFEAGSSTSVNDIHSELVQNFDEVFELSGRRRLINQILNMLGYNQTHNSCDDGNFFTPNSDDSFNKKQNSSQVVDSLMEERFYRHRFLLHSAYLIWNSKLRDSIFKFFYNEDKFRAVEYFISQQALQVVKSLKSSNKGDSKAGKDDQSLSSGLEKDGLSSSNANFDFNFQSKQKDANSASAKSKNPAIEKVGSTSNLPKDILQSTTEAPKSTKGNGPDADGVSELKSDGVKSLPNESTEPFENSSDSSTTFESNKVVPYCQALIELLNSQISLMVDETSDTSIIATFASGQLSILKMCADPDNTDGAESLELGSSISHTQSLVNRISSDTGRSIASSKPAVGADSSSSKNLIRSSRLQREIRAQALAENSENIIKTRMISGVKNMQVFMVKREDFIDCPLYFMDCFYGANVDMSKLSSTLWPVWVPIEILLNSDDSDIGTLKYSSEADKNSNGGPNNKESNKAKGSKVNPQKPQKPRNRQNYHKIIERTSGVTVFDKPNSQCINSDDNHFNDLRMLSQNQDLELLFGDDAIEKLKEYLISGDISLISAHNNPSRPSDSDWLEKNIESTLFGSGITENTHTSANDTKFSGASFFSSKSHKKAKDSPLPAENKPTKHDESKAAFILVRMSQISIVCTSEQYLAIMALISQLLIYNEPERASYLDELNSIKLTTDLSSISDAGPLVNQIQNSLRTRRQMMNSWHEIQWNYNYLSDVRAAPSLDLASYERNNTFNNDMLYSLDTPYHQSAFISSINKNANVTESDFKTCASQGSAILSLSYQIKALEHQLRITMDLVSLTKRKNSHSSRDSDDPLYDKKSMATHRSRGSIYSTHTKSHSAPTYSKEPSPSTASVPNSDDRICAAPSVSNTVASSPALDLLESPKPTGRKKLWDKLRQGARNIKDGRSANGFSYAETSTTSATAVDSGSMNEPHPDSKLNKNKQGSLSLKSSSKFANSTDMTKRLSVAQKISVYVASFNLRMLDADNNSLCDLKTKNLYSSITTSTSQATDVLVEIDLLVALNRTQNALYPHIIVPYVSDANSNYDFGKNKMITVYYSESPPVGGIGIVELLEIDITPLRLMLSHDIGKKLLNYFFPPPDSQPFEAGPISKLNTIPEDANGDEGILDLVKARPKRFRGFLNKKSDSSLRSSDSYAPLNGQSKSTSPANMNDLSQENVKYSSTGPTSKNKVEKSTQNDMKTRASKNKTFIAINIPDHDHLLSYRGPKKFNVADLSDFVFHSPNLQFRNEVLSYYELAMKLKRAFINAALQHTGAIIKEKFKQIRNKGASSSKDYKDTFAEELVQKIDDADVLARKVNLPSSNLKDISCKTDAELQSEHGSNKEALLNLIPTSLFTPFVVSSPGMYMTSLNSIRKPKENAESSEYSNLLGPLGKYNINKLNPFSSRASGTLGSDGLKPKPSHKKQHSEDVNFHISEDESGPMFRKYRSRKKSSTQLEAAESTIEVKDSPRSKKDFKFGFRKSQDDSKLLENRENHSD